MRRPGRRKRKRRALERGHAGMLGALLRTRPSYGIAWLPPLRAAGWAYRWPLGGSWWTRGGLWSKSGDETGRRRRRLIGAVALRAGRAP